MNWGTILFLIGIYVLGVFLLPYFVYYHFLPINSAVETIPIKFFILAGIVGMTFLSILGLLLIANYSLYRFFKINKFFDDTDNKGNEKNEFLILNLEVIRFSILIQIFALGISLFNSNNNNSISNDAFSIFITSLILSVIAIILKLKSKKIIQKILKLKKQILKSKIIQKILKSKKSQENSKEGESKKRKSDDSQEAKQNNQQKESQENLKVRIKVCFLKAKIKFKNLLYYLFTLIYLFLFIFSISFIFNLLIQTFNLGIFISIFVGIIYIFINVAIIDAFYRKQYLHLTISMFIIPIFFIMPLMLSNTYIKSLQALYSFFGVTSDRNIVCIKRDYPLIEMFKDKYNKEKRVNEAKNSSIALKLACENKKNFICFENLEIVWNGDKSIWINIDDNIAPISIPKKYLLNEDIIIYKSSDSTKNKEKQNDNKKEKNNNSKIQKNSPN